MQQTVNYSSLSSFWFLPPPQSAHIGGELTSLRAQLKRLEGDLGEYKGINKQYTDQLVKVKVS